MGLGFRSKWKHKVRKEIHIFLQGEKITHIPSCVSKCTVGQRQEKFGDCFREGKYVLCLGLCMWVHLMELCSFMGATDSDGQSV